MREEIRRFAETVELSSHAGSRARLRRYAGIGVLLIATITGAWLMSWTRQTGLELLSTVESLSVEQHALEDEIRKMRSGIARLGAPGRVTTFAIDSLGMHPVPLDRWYLLEEPPADTTPRNELVSLGRSLERLWVSLPGIEQTEATAIELDTLRLDSLTLREPSEP